MQHHQQNQPYDGERHAHGYYYDYVAHHRTISESDQAAYVRALGETNVFSAEFDRATKQLADCVNATVRTDMNSQKHIMDLLRHVIGMVELFKSKSIVAMSARVYLSHHINHLISQLRQAATTNSTIVNQLCQQRRASREAALNSEEFRSQVEQLEHSLTESQQQTVNLATEVESLRRQCNDLGTVTTTQAERHERGGRFFSALLELVANYESGSSAADAVMNRGADFMQQDAGEMIQPPPSREPHRCSMCLAQHATVISRPCNHLISCTSCTIELARRHGAELATSDVVANLCGDAISAASPIPCPRCRAAVSDFLYVYV